MPRQLHSTVTDDGTIVLSIAEVDVPEPRADQVVIRVEAAPINPSDLGLLLGPADMATLRAEGSEDAPVLTARVPPAGVAAVRARLGQSMPVGNEGAGLRQRLAVRAERERGRCCAK